MKEMKEMKERDPNLQIGKCKSSSEGFLASVHSIGSSIIIPNILSLTILSIFSPTQSQEHYILKIKFHLLYYYFLASWIFIFLFQQIFFKYFKNITLSLL